MLCTLDETNEQFRGELRAALFWSIAAAVIVMLSLLVHTVQDQLMNKTLYKLVNPYSDLWICSLHQ